MQTHVWVHRDTSQMERFAKEKVSPTDFWQVYNRVSSSRITEQPKVPKDPNVRLTQKTKHHVRLQQAAASA